MPQSQWRTVSGHCNGTLGTLNQSHPGYDDALEVVTITADVGGWPVHAYLLVCKATNEAAIIDTAAHPDDVLQKVEETGVKPTVNSADTRTWRSRERFDGDRTRNGLPDLHSRTGTTAA